MDLVHLIYCSTSSKVPVSATELQALLDQSRRNNAELGITGILLHQEGSYFQVLGGERAVVEALFERIGADQRHYRVSKIVVEPITQRAFAEWTMGYPRVSAKELAAIPGLNDFFTQGRALSELGEGRAKALLAAFKEGRWRSSIEGGVRGYKIISAK